MVVYELRRAAYFRNVQVAQIAYDKFVLELPEVDAGPRLADREVAEEAAGWLWDFGPNPVVALVAHDGDRPTWLERWTTQGVAFNGGPATGVVLPTRADLQRFLAEGAPHERTRLLWPRRSSAKLFEALTLGAGTKQWLETVDAYAEVVRDGTVVELHQVA